MWHLTPPSLRSSALQKHIALHFSQQVVFCIVGALAKHTSLPKTVQIIYGCLSWMLQHAVPLNILQGVHYLTAFVTLQFTPIWDRISFNSPSHAKQDKMLARPQLDAQLCYQLSCCWDFKAYRLLLCNHTEPQLPGKEANTYLIQLTCFTCFELFEEPIYLTAGPHKHPQKSHWRKMIEWKLLQIVTSPVFRLVTLRVKFTNL